MESNRVPLTLRDPFFSDPFFSSSWSDFDTLRQDMVKESKEIWDRLGAPASDDKGLLSPFFVPRPWMFPLAAGADRPGGPSALDRQISIEKLANRDEQVIRVKDDSTKFEVSLDTHGFRPDEIKVSVDKDHRLSIEAKHEEKAEGRYVNRQFSRSFTLPKECSASEVNSNLSADGVLMITAPKRAIGIDNRSVPIEMKK